MSDVQILDLSNEEYHARPEWSSSQVKLLPRDVELFHRRHIEKHPAFQFKQTASMAIGTAVHDIVLEDTPVVMIPEEVLQRRKKKGSETEFTFAKAGAPWEEFKAAHPGAVLCKDDDPILHMVASIKGEPAAMKWLDAEGPVEQSMFYRDEETGLGLRARLDKLCLASGGSVILDLKSTVVDPHSEREVAKQIYTFGYHRQGAWYWDAAEAWGHDIEALLLAFVRNSAPYDCHVWELSGMALELGRHRNRTARRELAARLQSNNWKPESFGRISMIDVPDWAYQQEGEVIYDD